MSCKRPHHSKTQSVDRAIPGIQQNPPHAHQLQIKPENCLAAILPLHSQHEFKVGWKD